MKPTFPSPIAYVNPPLIKELVGQASSKVGKLGILCHVKAHLTRGDWLCLSRDKSCCVLLALLRLKVVRLCIRSALHQIKRLIHPQGPTSVAGCPSVCLSPTAGQAKKYRKGDLGWPSAKELLTSLIVHDCPWHGCPLIELFPARELSLLGVCAPAPLQVF